MNAALVIDGVVRDGDVHVVDPFYRTKRVRWAKKTGDGVAVKVRIEEAEASARHGHYKHLFGHYLAPTSEETGYTVTELKEDMKARFLPDGMTSLTDMTAAQFEEFNRAVEQCIREEFPDECWAACVDAMALYDRTQ